MRNFEFFISFKLHVLTVESGSDSTSWFRNLDIMTILYIIYVCENGTMAYLVITRLYCISFMQWVCSSYLHSTNCVHECVPTMATRLSNHFLIIYKLKNNGSPVTFSVEFTILAFELLVTYFRLFWKVQ